MTNKLLHTIFKHMKPIIASAMVAAMFSGSVSYAADNVIDAELGDTYTIGAGYYDEATTINVPTLASQTPGSATASDILKGKTAFVNGEEVTGDIDNASIAGGINSSDGYTASILAHSYTGAGSSVTIDKAVISGGVNSSDGYTATIAGGKFTGENGSSVTINKAAVAGGVNSSDGYTATIAGGKFTGENGSSVTINKAVISGGVNSSDGYTATIAGGKFTGENGSSVTVNKAAVVGSAQTDGTFRYSIAGGSFTGAGGSSGSISKLVPSYSTGSSQSAVKAGGTVTLPAGTYNKDALTITADTLANQTVGTAADTDILSGKTAWVGGEKITGTIENASVTGAVNDSDGYTASISARKYTGSGSSVVINKASVTGAVNSSDGYTASIAGNSFTGASGTSVTVAKGSVSGAAQTDGSFKYSIAGGKYTGAKGSSGTIAKLTPTYTTGSSQSNLISGGTVTLPAGTYNKSEIVITGGSMTGKYDLSGAGTAGASGKPETSTSKLYWDMGENNMNRYVSISKSTASATSLNAGGSATIPVGYVSSAITVSAKKPTAKYAVSGAGTAGASGKPETDTSKLYWDMGETSMNRYVSIPKSTASATSLNVGGSATIPVGYVSSAITVSAKKPTAKYAVSGAGTAGASGKPETDTSKLYWDMGETSMNRYVSIPKSTASATSLNAGGSATIPVGYVSSAITVSAKKPTSVYALSGAGTAGASGKPVTDTSKLYWDMGETSMNRYVSIAKSNGATASINSGGSKTISAGYLPSAVTITANKPTSVYTVSGAGTAGASGKAVTDKSKVFWDMGETSMNRYVSINKLTTAKLTVDSGGGAYNALVAGHKLTIPAGYYTSTALTVTAVNDYNMELVTNSNGTYTLNITSVN